MQTTKTIQERLEYLRGELRKECISYGELAELESLAEYIDKEDTELLQAAGVPEDVDLFLTPELIPTEVREVFEQYNEVEYSDCEEIVATLLELGYTCDYDLGCEFYDLRKI